jgi:hypothetical protein
MVVITTPYITVLSYIGVISVLNQYTKLNFFKILILLNNTYTSECDSLSIEDNKKALSNHLIQFNKLLPTIVQVFLVKKIKISI